MPNTSEQRSRTSTQRIVTVLVVVGFLGAATFAYVFSSEYLNVASNGRVTSDTSTGPQISIEIATTTSSSTMNASIGLQLELQLSANSGGSLGISVDELNILNSTNNITAESDWAYPPAFLNPDSECDVSLPYFGPETPFGFAVLQGYYGVNNFTAAKALPLYNTSEISSCVHYSATFSSVNPYYSFAPLSNQGNYFYPGVQIHQFDSVTITTFGYWTGGISVPPVLFHRFTPGEYTVLAADEWGQIVLLHYMVKEG